MGVHVPGAAGFCAATCVFIHAERKQNPKSFISPKILSISDKSRNLTTQMRDEPGLPEKDISDVLFGKNQDYGFNVSEGIRSMHQTSQQIHGGVFGFVFGSILCRSIIYSNKGS